MSGPVAPRAAICRPACIVPAYQAARTVGEVVSALRAALPGVDVVVVDDGSADDTGGIARAAGAEVLRFGANRGKGAALRAGFAAARDRGADALLSVDADGQHDPAAAPALLAALADADLVIGTRPRAGTRMPIQRRMSNALSSAAISRCAGCTIADAQSGFRAMRADVLRRVEPRGDRYEYETDLLILAARAGFAIVGVPVPTIYGGARSHFRPLHDASRVVATIWRHRREAFS